jgi:hypothetical protein
MVGPDPAIHALAGERRTLMAAIRAAKTFDVPYFNDSGY